MLRGKKKLSWYLRYLVSLRDYVLLDYALFYLSALREQAWRSGESASLSPKWPGCDWGLDVIFGLSLFLNHSAPGSSTFPLSSKIHLVGFFLDSLSSWLNHSEMMMMIIIIVNDNNFHRYNEYFLYLPSPIIIIVVAVIVATSHPSANAQIL